MQTLGNSSFIIYLETNPEFIEKRIDTENRGIIGLKDKDFHTLHAERENLYKKYADLSVDVTEKSPEQIAEEILSLLKF